MSKAVMETQCTRCEHGEVCSLKEEFLKVSGSVKSDLDWVRIEVKCKHYRGSLQMPRDISVPYVNPIDCPYKNTICIYKSLSGCVKPITATCPYEAATTAITYTNGTKGDQALY